MTFLPVFKRHTNLWLFYQFSDDILTYDFFTSFRTTYNILPEFVFGLLGSGCGHICTSSLFMWLSRCHRAAGLRILSHASAFRLLQEQHRIKAQSQTKMRISRSCPSRLSTDLHIRCDGTLVFLHQAAGVAHHNLLLPFPAHRQNK